MPAENQLTGGVVILISADVEWAAVTRLLPVPKRRSSPLGEWFEWPAPEGLSQPVIFFHGGWGKIAAAASTQYAIDRWKPRGLINLGTCGGIQGRVSRGETLLVERTLVYDIYELMGDADEHLDFYRTDLDLTWLEGARLPLPVRRVLLVSADRDLIPEQLTELVERFEARAADWESGAIAWTAKRSAVPLLILRGVGDLVGASGGEAYGGLSFFERSAHEILGQFIQTLPGWLVLLQRSWQRSATS